MAYTDTFSVDAVGNPEPIIVATVCNRVKVRQDDLSGNKTQFKVRKPFATSNPVLYEGGMSVEFMQPEGKFWFPGDPIAYIEMVAGSDTFQRVED